ncbi:hypothetical protein, partial [Escherichia coli]
KSQSLEYDFGLDKKIVVERLIRTDVSIDDIITNISSNDEFKTFVDKQIYSIMEKGGIFSL